LSAWRLRSNFVVTIPKGVTSSKLTNIASTLYDYVTLINIAYVCTVTIITNKSLQYPTGCLNDIYVTLHNKCSKIPPCLIASPAWRSRVCLSWSSRFFMRAAASKMRDKNSSRVSNPTNKNLTQLSVEIQTALFR
jgi:hypothetical protein